MGNSLSPILSHFVLEDLLDMALQRTKFKVKLIYKYVDDLITLIESKLIDIDKKFKLCISDKLSQLRYTIRNICKTQAHLVK